MLVPLLSLITALILLINAVLLYQKSPRYQAFPWLIRHKNEPIFILAISLLFLFLSLGIIGYWGLINAMFLQIIRKILGISGGILLLLTFWRELGHQPLLLRQLPIVLNAKAYVYRHRTILLVSLLLAIIAIAFMSPMASQRVIFSVNDHLSHIGYIVQARMALEEGQFPIRVAPLEAYGMRYAGFQFYSQLPYTLGGIIYKFITPQNPYSAYKIMLWLALWMGGLFIYRLGLSLTRSQVAAVLAGVSYMSAPYFLNNIHARGAFTEAIAQGILPIVLFYIFQIYTTSKKRYIFLSAIAWFALATTHIITFIYSTIFIAIFSVILLLKSKLINWPKQRIFLIIISYFLGWLLALYFLAPVALGSENLPIRRQINVINPFDTRWMTPLANLISPTSMPSEPTETGIAPTYGLHPAVGWIFLAAWGIVVYYYFSGQSFPPRLQRIRPFVISLLSVFLIAFFLTWSPINIWAILPKQLWVTQFTFRILTHVMWTGALLTPLAIILIFRERLDRRHLILGILIIVIISRPWLPIPKGTVTVDELKKEPLFRYSGALDYLYQTPIKTLYGKAELPVLALDWTPGYASWDVFLNRNLELFAQYPDATSFRLQKPVGYLARFRYPKPIGKEPFLIIEGEIPDEDLTSDSSLLLQVNQQTIMEVPLSSPQFNLRIPFKDIPISDPDFVVTFFLKAPSPETKPPRLLMKRFMFDGLSSQATILSVDQTKEKCQQIGKTTVCKINVNEDAENVQLPIFYYPEMQQVIVNNQVTDSFPIYYKDYNLLGVKLKPGFHTIKVTFVGLVWANWVSLLSWLGIILAGIKLVLQNLGSTSKINLTVRTREQKTGNRE